MVSTSNFGTYGISEKKNLILNIATYSFQFINLQNRPAGFDGPDITVTKKLRYPSRIVLYTKF
jgi:hypothetical protein